MSANTLPSPAPRAARLANPIASLIACLVVSLLVGLAGLVGIASQATAVAGATITGRFVTEDGVPVDAIRTILVDPSNGNFVKDVTTGADATFELTGVPAGTYELQGHDMFDNYALIPSMSLTVADGQTKAVGDLELDYFTGMRPSIRLTGVVRDPSGKPVRGIQVLTRTNTPLESGSQITGLAVTDRTGRYYFDSVGDGTPPPGTYKLAFSDRRVLEDETFFNGGRYSGDQPTWARADTVDVPSTGLNTAAAVTVIRNGGISGKLTGTVPMTDGNVTVYDADGEQVATEVVDPGVTYTIPTLRPGSYYVRFHSEDPSPSGGAKFVRAFWPGAASLADATPVVVKSGVFKTGVNQLLSDQLVAYRKPSISGRPTVGSTLTASPGSWSLTTSIEYSYEWLRGTVVVGRSKTYRPGSADASKALKVRVTARRLNKSGTATSASTAAVKWVSAVSAKGSYSRAKKRLTLTVRAAVRGLSNPGGTVTVKEGSRTVKARVAVRNGAAVITISRPKPGLHTYALSYSGTSKVLSDTGSVRVRVPR